MRDVARWRATGDSRENSGILLLSKHQKLNGKNNFFFHFVQFNNNNWQDFVQPKKRPMSPTIGTIRNRCPTVSEKDFYRKTASLDRRERYPTLSGAEIKRSCLPAGGGEALQQHRGNNKRNPMLDRKNRFPTISGAELKRGIAVGKCPLEDGLDLSLAPWPGMRWACVRVLHLYCKVFDQSELFELIVR